MLDRASTFADEDIIELLQRRYVPVALDVWFQDRRQDAEGEFYRSIVSKRDGYSPDRTTQGFYVFDPDGQVFAAWNNRDPGKVKRILRKTLKSYAAPRAAEPSQPASEATVDPSFDREPPAGSLVLSVFSRILDASYAEEPDRWSELLRSSTGRDHLWVLASEVEALARGETPRGFLTRLARFHLIDNTRGEPPMWSPDQVKSLAMNLSPLEGRKAKKLRMHQGSQLLVASGETTLATEDGSRGFTARLGGVIEVVDGELMRVDLVATGAYHGVGRYTGASAPEGEFTIGIAFTLAGDDAAARVPPQGCRDRRGYLRGGR